VVQELHQQLQLLRFQEAVEEVVVTMELLQPVVVLPQDPILVELLEQQTLVAVEVEQEITQVEIQLEVPEVQV
jgi:hypothetical protein